MKRLTTAQIAPVRAKLLGQQKYICPLCQGSMKGGNKKPALDHDHQTGYLRDVLCLNCNRAEGEVLNRANRAKGTELTPLEWLRNLVAYHERHQTSQHNGLIHPTHKTPEEKRLATNAKARKKRAAAKRV